MKTETRVLVADDEPDMLRGLERTLSKEGYRVDGALDGLEATTRLDAERFDVVVSDLRMPHVDGMELLRRAKEKNKSVVFIIITAYGTVESALEAMRLGSFDYISKPFAPSVLLAAIERGLGMKALEATHTTTAVAESSAVLRFEDAWASVQPDGTVVVGANDRFFEEAGDIVFCDLPFEGAQILKGQRCARTIDSTGLIQKPFHCPLSGTVIEVNESMEHEPWEVQKHPYGEGWLFRMAPSRFEEESRALKAGKQGW